MITAIDLTSPEWLQLNDEERYERIEPICDQFILKFGALPKVNYIGHSRVQIYVETALPEGSRIEALPAEYYGVPVEQCTRREAMDLFLATWRMILDRIGDWPADRIAEFANDQHSCFRGGWFLHDSPIDFVVRALLPEDLEPKFNLQVYREIWTAIDSGMPIGSSNWHPDLNPSFDWAAARSRVHAVFESLRNQP